MRNSHLGNLTSWKYITKSLQISTSPKYKQDFWTRWRPFRPTKCTKIGDLPTFSHFLSEIKVSELWGKSNVHDLFYKQLEIFVRYWSCLTSVPIFSAIPPTLPPQIGLKWPSQAAESFDIVFFGSRQIFLDFCKKNRQNLSSSYL